MSTRLSFTPEQYDMRMKATRFLKFSEVSLSLASGSFLSQETEIHLEETQEAKLRKRRTDVEQEKLDKDESKTEEMVELFNNKVEQKAASDPIYWFGGFAHPSLRQSQAIFTSGLEIIVELANLQIGLDKIEEEILYLKQQKKQLSASSDIQEKEAKGDE